MSDCCNSAPGFPTAGQMEQMALNHPIVWQEICAIQQAILRAASQCQPGGGRMCTVVGGSTPMTFVSRLLGVNIINPGAGYVSDEPIIEFVPPFGATVTPAQATLVTNGSGIMDVIITDPGQGYQPIHPTVQVSSVAGTGADIQLYVNASGEIIGTNLVSGGLGYTIDDDIVITRAVPNNSAYVEAVLKITDVSPVGRILGVSILKAGTGYQESVASAKITSKLQPGSNYPSGVGFDASVYVNATGGITQVRVNNPGAGYGELLPKLVISDIGTGAVTRVTLSGDSIGAIAVVSGGSSYTANASGVVINPGTAALPPTTPAVVALDIAVNNFGTDPTVYHKVWSGAMSDRQIQLQLSTVISYFERLGYTITIQTNPSTGTTIQWKICW